MLRPAMFPAVILAAGSSTRMGQPKALLPAGPGGDVFVTRLVRTFAAAGADDILVVVGPEAHLVRGAFAACGTPVRIIENPEPARGQLSSLLAALAIVDRPGVQGMVVTPVDVPLVSVE